MFANTDERKRRRARGWVAAAGLLSTVAWGVEISDDFDDGNATEWTESNPLAGFGGMATYSFPGGNSYRIVTGPSPDPGGLGAARAGAYRPDATYTNAFKVAVDVVAWDNSLEQDIGVLALASNPGLGTLNGYAFSHDTDAGAVFISRLDGEMPTTVASAPVSLAAGQAYRLVFQGFEGTLCGEVYAVADLSTPLQIVPGFDATYTTGFCGVFNNSGLASGMGTTDSTFDNYFSGDDTDADKDGLPDQWEIDEIGDLIDSGSDDFDKDGQDNLTEYLAGTDPADARSRFMVTAVTAAGGQMTLDFPIVVGRTYLLETSPDMDRFTEDTGAVFTSNGSTGSLTTAVDINVDKYARVKVQF